MRLSSTIAAASAALVITGVVCPRVAEACGGTFCDSGPRAMPVDQTGENIVFVMEPGKVEAHIQIQYKGEAAKFSWILPVQALPEVEVGSQAFFDRLLQATVPMYSFGNRFDFCGASVGTTGGSASGAGGSGVFGGSGGGGGGGPTGGPVVVLQKAVGAFDVTVLSGGTTPEVIKWLTDNQYQVPPMASTLLDGYVAKQYLFVAVKLTGGKDIDEIHPLVIRFPGTEPCVPLKLTAVAAADDMGIRTFFLGTERVVPKNFKHVVPNLAKLDWFNPTTSYTEFVSRAVDSPIANGQAFVTEYAGPTAIVGASPFASTQWNAVPFVTAPAKNVMQLLQQQGLASCVGGVSGQCTFNHVLLAPLLHQYLPPPATLTVNGSQLTDPGLIETVFYACPSCYESQIDQTKWSGPGFATDLGKRIIEPAKHADALLKAWPYLTRMFTTMSAVEMTADPEFFARPGLPNVPLIRSTATLRTTCGGSTGMILPGGRNVAVPARGTWPLFPNTMPWAERIEEIQATGDPVLLVDNNAAIDRELKAWNDSQRWVPDNATTATTGAGSGGAGQGGASQGGQGGLGQGGLGQGGLGQGGLGQGGLAQGGASQGGAGPRGASQGGAGGADAASPSSTAAGCGCRTVTSSSSAGMPFGLVLLLGLMRRIRRRAAS